MYLFQKIEEVIISNNGARQAVGEFVLHEKDNLYKYTIDEIAEITYTSKATVVRFAKSLGYDGWKEFIKDFIAEVKYQSMHQGDVDVNAPFSENDTTEDIIQKIKTVQMESIQDTADIMNATMIDLATKYLINAKHIVIFGVSPNAYLGELFRRKLITIGKQIDIARSDETGIISRTMTPDDCAIMISYSGNNPHVEPLCHLDTLLKANVPTIGITSDGDNYMRRRLNCVLTISSRERLYTKISNFASEESITYILNVLFSCYFVKNYQENYMYKIQNSKILETSRRATLKEMQDDE